MSIKIISDQTKPQKIKKYFKNIFHGNLIYIVSWVSPRTKADVGGLHTPLIGPGGRATSCRCSSVNDGSVNDGKQIAFVHTGRRQPMLTIPVSFVVIVMPSKVHLFFYAPNFPDKIQHKIRRMLLFEINFQVLDKN